MKKQRPKEIAATEKKKEKKNNQAQTKQQQQQKRQIVCVICPIRILFRVTAKLVLEGYSVYIETSAAGRYLR